MNQTFVDIYIVLSATGLLLLGLAAYGFHRKYRRLKEEKERMEEAYGKLAELAEKSTLPVIESKLNPHLFKNILNSIQSHAYQTYYAMDKMANVLDYILYESSRGLVTPQEEIDFALNLIEINKIKLSPLFALSVKKKVDEYDLLYRQPVMAPLVSVDLIENAFKHADLQSGDAFISIAFEFRKGVFSITVSNKISSKPLLHKEKSGVGMMTFEHRLQILYKGRFTLQRVTENNVYTAYLSIDLHEKTAEMPAS